ncbi:MAG: thioredoxin-related protein [Bacteroidia bacterium]|jgi:thioredoxin-related protein
MNDSNIMTFSRLDKPPPKSYFYPKGYSKDSIKDKTWIVVDTTTKMELPFSDLSTLDSTIHVSGPTYQNRKSVVVYSYISCPPCAVLKSKIQEEVNKGKIDNTLIVVLNTFDEKANLERFIEKKAYTFPYYKTKERNANGSYPKICGYDETGNLDWTIYGYAPSVVKKVVKYLNE